LGSVAPTPVRARNTESFLDGREITENSIDEASRLVSGDINPVTDIRASAEYRKEISSVLVKRVLQRAVETAQR
jgi:CO/xanthine dehydrogenase FAD-binding subunit